MAAGGASDAHLDTYRGGGGGRFLGQYTPTIRGLYLLSVTLGGGAGAGAHVRGSPFAVVVAPAPTHARMSRAFGAGLRAAHVPANRAGSLLSVTLEAHDAFGNLRGVGGDAFEVHAYHAAGSGDSGWAAAGVSNRDGNAGSASPGHPAGAKRLQSRGAGLPLQPLATALVGTVLDHGDGTYTARWRPLLSGNYRVAVTLRGVHVSHSPYGVAVAPAAVVSARGSVCDGDGVTMATAGVAVRSSATARSLARSLATDGRTDGRTD